MKNHSESASPIEIRSKSPFRLQERDDRSNNSQRPSEAISDFQNGFFSAVLNPDFSAHDFKKRSSHFAQNTPKKAPSLFEHATPLRKSTGIAFKENFVSLSDVSEYFGLPKFSD